MTIYAIGDIHGHNDKLQAALAWIEADGGPDAQVVMLGDLVDRGPDSRGVIDTLMAGRDSGRNWTVLMGNHDRMFLEFLDRGQTHNPLVKSGRSWFDPVMGGMETLASYGLEPDAAPEALFEQAQDAVPAAHRAFLAANPLYAERGRHLFVHAGIKPGVALTEQDESDLLWIRDPFLKHPDPFDWLVVHGHTALQTPRHHGNRVNLDGGAGYGRALSAAAIDGDTVFLLGPEGRTHLPGDAD
ncbi:MAG: serine/threonine protein phosphatase [Rhodobacter sp.]|nr:serine/threonine protein phosphatase [Paracoccaceae bacterium]MCC0077726.1 serine/threonine protein phosphatase [Rhodobacter sp.]